MMKYNLGLILIFLTTLTFSSCSNHNDIDYLVFKEWEKCSIKKNCIINFSTEMNFEWDEMYFFPSALSLDEINTILDIELEEYTDIGDRVIFTYDNKIVYQQEWFPRPSENHNEIIFKFNGNFLRTDHKNALFSIQRRGNFYYLEKIHN